MGKSGGTMFMGEYRHNTDSKGRIIIHLDKAISLSNDSLLKYQWNNSHSPNNNGMKMTTTIVIRLVAAAK